GVLVRALGYGYHHGPEETFRCCQTPVFKFYICDNVPLAPLRQQLQSIPGIALTQSGENNIEVMPIGVDKGTGVRDMARMLGISMDQVMTLGDQENDIPMLMAAGYGVAMGNASDATKKVARYQTEDLDHGGFAKAIRRWALKEE
ncbi:MAG: HAD-IIB family hydrolase, partial [Clostridiales bacterium]|nr:HAD-IIB family hydrolase [Clostridiales bacterium]